MRFSEGDYDYPGQWALWEEALYRAVNGKRGQRVLRDLERALVELPEPKLIDGSLSDGVGVCAVGAYVAQQKVEAGEDRDEVLASLRRLAWNERWNAFDGYEAEMSTIDQARAAGMQLTVAVAVAGLNDDLYKVTPEQRYERVLSWVRQRILPEVSNQDQEQA